MNVKELKELAKTKGIAGYSTMKKADLIAALQ
jgi:Rho termination factor, N-terminal domain.